jgi:hypothetical protein
MSPAGGLPRGYWTVEMASWDYSLNINVEYAAFLQLSRLNFMAIANSILFVKYYSWQWENYASSPTIISIFNGCPAGHLLIKRIFILKIHA